MKGDLKRKNYMAEGMIIGLIFGVAITVIFPNLFGDNMGYAIAKNATCGMGIGVLIGMRIKKGNKK